jgi:hypothetical protein
MRRLWHPRCAHAAGGGSCVLALRAIAVAVVAAAALLAVCTICECNGNSPTAISRADHIICTRYMLHFDITVTRCCTLQNTHNIPYI